MMMAIIYSAVPAQRGIRVSVVEPAYTKTQFTADFLEPDAKLDEYREVCAALGKRMTELIEKADELASQRRQCSRPPWRLTRSSDTPPVVARAA